MSALSIVRNIEPASAEEKSVLLVTDDNGVRLADGEEETPRALEILALAQASFRRQKENEARISAEGWAQQRVINKRKHQAYLRVARNLRGLPPLIVEALIQRGLTTRLRVTHWVLGGADGDEPWGERWIQIGPARRQEIRRWLGMRAERKRRLSPTAIKGAITLLRRAGYSVKRRK